MNHAVCRQISICFWILLSALPSEWNRHRRLSDIFVHLFVQFLPCCKHSCWRCVALTNTRPGLSNICEERFPTNAMYDISANVDRQEADRYSSFIVAILLSVRDSFENSTRILSDFVQRRLDNHDTVKFEVIVRVSNRSADNSANSMNFTRVLFERQTVI